MKFVCPNCQRPFLPENLNVQTDLALCKACGHVARISQLADQDFSPLVLGEPPPGAWYRDAGYEIVMGATTRHASAFFLVPFMLVWSGGSLGGIYGKQILSGQFNLTMSLFGIPFLLGSLLFWSIALMAVCGKVEIRVRENLGTIFTGVGPVGWKRSFDLDQIDVIEEGSSQTRYSGNQGGVIILRGKTLLRFGSNVAEARRYFLMQALRQLKSRRRPAAR